jgi:hypothetical protein
MENEMRHKEKIIGLMEEKFSQSDETFSNENKFI